MRSLCNNKSGLIGIGLTLILVLILFIVAVIVMVLFTELLIIAIIVIALITVIYLVIRYAPMPYKLYVPIVLIGVGFALVALYYFGLMPFLVYA